MSSGGQIHSHISDDRKTVTLRIEPSDDSGIELVLTVDQLTALIHFLGKVRCNMLEGLPAPPLEGQTVVTATGPSWYIQPAKIDGPLLAFDHPSFGPVGFALLREDVEGIVRLLKNYLALPPAAPQKAH